MSKNAQVEGADPGQAAPEKSLDPAPQESEDLVEDESLIEPYVDEPDLERALDEVLEGAVRDRVHHRVFHQPDKTLFIVKLGPNDDRVELCVLASTAVEALAEAKQFMQQTSDEDVDIRILAENVTLLFA